MGDKKYGPRDYGMDEKFKGRECLSLYFQHIPVVSEHQTQTLFGFIVGPSIRAALKNERFVQLVNDPRNGRLLFRYDYRAVTPRVPPSYMEQGWDPLVAPIVLKTLYREGDNLLLGQNFITWAGNQRGVASSMLPRHWLAENGGYGGGMLLRQGKDRVEEWVFVMDHNAAKFKVQVRAFFGDIVGIIQARIKEGHAPPRVRLMMTHRGARGTPGREVFHRQLMDRYGAFPEGIEIRHAQYGPSNLPGRVKLEYGMVVGTWNPDPTKWKIWEQEKGAAARDFISPVPLTTDRLGASKVKRRSLTILEKFEKVVARIRPATKEHQP